MLWRRNVWKLAFKHSNSDLWSPSDSMLALHVLGFHRQILQSLCPEIWDGGIMLGKIKPKLIHSLMKFISHLVQLKLCDLFRFFPFTEGFLTVGLLSRWAKGSRALARIEIDGWIYSWKWKHFHGRVFHGFPIWRCLEDDKQDHGRVIPLEDVWKILEDRWLDQYLPQLTPIFFELSNEGSRAERCQILCRFFAWTVHGESDPCWPHG